MVDLTKPVQTRDGRPVRILCTDYHAADRYCVVGVVSEPGSPSDLIIRWGLDGKTFGYALAYDLVNAPTKYYVNVFRRAGGGIVLGTPVSTEAVEPRFAAKDDFIKRIEIDVP